MSHDRAHPPHIACMSCYFPLFPCFTHSFPSSSGQQSRIISTNLLFVNSPGNQTSKSSELSHLIKPAYLHVYSLNSSMWSLVETIKCEVGESRVMSASSYEPSSFVVMVPSFVSNSSKETRYLPDPCSRKLDLAPVSERVSYQFEYGRSVACYQGEYPAAMAQRCNGSFLSFDSLRADKNPSECMTYCYFLNLFTDAENASSHQISVLNPNTKKTVAQISVKTNSANLTNITQIAPSLADDLHLLVSKSASFIPVFLNISTNPEHDEIDVEHTHPPHEMLWGSSKFELISSLKSSWGAYID